jgi:hypothetical protein
MSKMSIFKRDYNIKKNKRRGIYIRRSRKFFCILSICMPQNYLNPLPHCITANVGSFNVDIISSEIDISERISDIDNV